MLSVIYKLSSAVINKDHSIFHLGDIFFINNSFCFREQWTMQEDNICLRQQFI